MFSLIIYILIAAVGFMMAVLFKRTETTASFFNPDDKPILKYFTITFVLGLGLTYFLSWLSMHSLASAQIPEEGNIQFNQWKETMYFVLNLSFLLLTILANLYSQSRKVVAWGSYVLVFLFYALFIVKDTYYLSPYYAEWQTAMLHIPDETVDFVQRGWTKLGLGFLVTALNAGLIWWGLRK